MLFFTIYCIKNKFYDENNIYIGGNLMNEKELIYVEDALNQLRLLRAKCNNYSSMMQDRELKAFVKEIETRQETIFTNIYKLLQ
jgi:hypothetical protein